MCTLQNLSSYPFTCMLESYCLSTRNKRKMLGGDWSWVYSTPPSRHLIFCTQHANHTQPGPVISGRSGLCLSSCHECLQRAAFRISRGVLSSSAHEAGNSEQNHLQSPGESFNKAFRSLQMHHSSTALDPTLLSLV